MGMAFAWEEKNEWNKCYRSRLFLDSHKSYRHLCILRPHSKSQVCQFQHKSCKQAIFWWIFTERFFLRASFWHCKQFLFFYKRKSLLQWLLSFIFFWMKWWNVKRTFLTIIFPTLLLLFTWHFHIRVWAFVCLFIHFFCWNLVLITQNWLLVIHAFAFAFEYEGNCLATHAQCETHQRTHMKCVGYHYFHLLQMKSEFQCHEILNMSTNRLYR